jgi:predicted nucleotidyltransferase
MTVRQRKRYGRIGGRLPAAILATIPGKLASHWFFQGLLYMDRTERLFKLGLDAAGTVVLTVPLTTAMPLPIAVVVGLLVAHTANFVFNGHLRGALKWNGVGGVSRIKLEAELATIAARICRSSSVDRAWVFGSVSRGELHDGSDLDIRVLRRPGFRAGMGACWLVLLERSRSLFSGVPMDIYVWDSAGRLSGMRSDEQGLDLSNRTSPNQTRDQIP